MQPVQKRIPILWGGVGPQSVEKAANRRYHLIASDVAGTYERVMRENGDRPEEYLIGFVHIAGIAGTREEAFEAMAEPCTWNGNQYALRTDLNGYTPPETARKTVADIRRAWEAGDYRAAFSVPRAGTVEDVTEYFLKVVRGEMGLITHIGLHAREPGMKTEDVHRTMTLYAQEVLPVLRKEAERVEKERAQTIAMSDHR
ncbi:MAG: hypothetical protein JOY61_05370 [Chloroflexi bacterium]|nr:hypothetical protein [Chloroflexota bacterium]